MSWGNAWGNSWGSSWGAIDGSVDPWTFTDIPAATIGATNQESNVITISGNASAVTLTFSGHASAQWKKNSGNYTLVSTTATVSVVAGDTIQLSLTAPSVHSASNSVSMSGGGVSDTFTVTAEAAADATPNAPTFESILNALANTTYQRSASISGMTIGETLTAVGAGLELSNDGINYASSVSFAATTTLRITLTTGDSGTTTVSGTINGVAVSLAATVLLYARSGRHSVHWGT